MHPMLRGIVFSHDSSETQYNMFRNVFQGFISLLGAELLLHRHFGVAFQFFPFPFFFLFFLVALITISFSVSIYSC